MSIIEANDIKVKPLMCGVQDILYSFYVTGILSISLLNEAIGYIYYYDNIREHSAINYQTPFAYLRSQLPESDDRIRFTIPIMLDKVSFN